MKKRSMLIAAIALISAMLMVFTGCAGSGKTNGESTTANGQGGSDIQASNAVTVKPSPTYSADDKLIALTFDDGPNSNSTNKILDILNKNGSVATFFVVGYNIDGNAETLNRAVQMGCEIGNHSNGHKNLTKCSADEIRAEVRKPNAAIKSVTGAEPKLFRVPGGAFKGIKSQIGMPLIQWSIDTEDWKFKDAAHPDRSAEEREADLKLIADRVVADAENGDIILMHDIYNFTADLCDLIVPALIEKGFKLVTVSELYEAYGVELQNGTVYYFAKKPQPVTEAPTLPAGSYTVSSRYDSVNLRTEASDESEILCEIPDGTVLTVEKSAPKWAYVSYNSSKGWVNTAFLVKTAS